MCIVSMVHDHYEPRIPQNWEPRFAPLPADGLPPLPALPAALQPLATAGDVQSLRDEVTALRKVIEDYGRALVAAKLIDDLTNQPDCEDPEKAKLKERVAELERRLSAVDSALRAST